MKPSFLRVSAGMSCAVACALGVSGVRAAGVAVLKEWNYHRDSSAKPLACLRIIDSHGPYLRLVTGSGNVDILRSRLAAYLEVPDSIPTRLTAENDVAPLREALAAMKEFAARYTASASLLDPPSAALSGHLARFDRGEVRFEGEWMGRDELSSILASRQREADARRKLEIEQVVLSEAREEQGLVMMDGRWVAEKERLDRPSSARTELSDTLWPLLNPEIEAARMAMKSLSSLAASQKGALKVRTERIHHVIRNLFLAEFRLSRQIVTCAAAEAAASTHDRHAGQWLKPNAFGTIRTDAARESRSKAAEIRHRSAEQLEACRAELLAQLHEADNVTADLHRLREHRATLILAETVRTIAARRFPSGEFRSSVPDESLVSIRTEIASRR